MELENIVANTVYLKAREGMMLSIGEIRDRDVTNTLIPCSSPQVSHTLNGSVI